jgi:hypothetical protein
VPDQGRTLADRLPETRVLRSERQLSR